MRRADDLHGGGDCEDVAAGIVSCSAMLRTRIKRPGMSSRRAIALSASAMSQGKYCKALISSVTALASLKCVVSAAAPSTERRCSATLTKAPASRCRASQSRPGRYGEDSAARRASRFSSRPASVAARLMAATPPYLSTRSRRSSTRRFCSLQSSSLTASRSTVWMRKRSRNSRRSVGTVVAVMIPPWFERRRRAFAGALTSAGSFCRPRAQLRCACFCVLRSLSSQNIRQVNQSEGYSTAHTLAGRMRIERLQGRRRFFGGSREPRSLEGGRVRSSAIAKGPAATLGRGATQMPASRRRCASTPGSRAGATCVPTMLVATACARPMAVARPPLSQSS